MFILTSTSSLYENSELNIFKNVEFLGEISNNWLNDLYEKIYTRLLNFADNRC